MIIKKQDIYVDCQDKLYTLFIRYFGKILFTACILILLISIFDGKGAEYTKRTIHIIIASIIVGLILERFMRKIAYKIIIDFDNNKITFFMCRTNDVKEYVFSSIISIRIKRYAKFSFREENILYNIIGNENIELVIDRLRREIGYDRK